MSLSPREEKALATLEEALRADDPRLAAVLGARRWSRPRLPVRHLVSLVGALLVLVVVATVLGPRLGLLTTGAVTGGVVVPWLLVAVRATTRR